MPKNNSFKPYQIKSNPGFKPGFNDLNVSTYGSDYAPFLYSNHSELYNHLENRNKLLNAQKQDFAAFNKAGALASDVAVLGNYIPHPLAQLIGRAGIVGNAVFNTSQAATNIQDGDYLGAGINMGLAALPLGLEKYGYLRAAANVTPNSPLSHIAQTNSNAWYRPLTALPKTANNPVVKNAIRFNRAVLGSDVLGFGANTFRNGGGKREEFIPISKPIVESSGVTKSLPYIKKSGNREVGNSVLRQLSILLNTPNSQSISNTPMITDAKSFYQDWLNSPMFNAMTSTIPASQTKALRSGFNSEVDVRVTDDRRLVGDNILGVNSSLNGIFINKDLPTRNDFKSTGLHELSHEYDNHGKLIPSLFNQIMQSKPAIKPSNRYSNYIGTPTETRARLMQLRMYGKEEGLYDPFTEIVTPGVLDKLKTHPKFQELKNRYGDDDILDLLNTIGKNSSGQKQPAMAMNGIDMQRLFDDLAAYKQKQPYYQSPYDNPKSIMSGLGSMNFGIGGPNASESLPNLFGEQTGFDALTADYSNVDSANSKSGWFGDVKNFVGNRRNRYGIYDALTGMANAHNESNNRAEEMRRLAELFQKPEFDNNTRYGLDSRPMYYQNGGNSYTIKKGDTLSAISKRIGVDLNTLVKMNKITNPNHIMPGQILQVPLNPIHNSNNKLKATTPNSKITGSPFDKIAANNPNLDIFNAYPPVVRMYAEQMMLNGNKLFLTDKGSKTQFYEDNDGTIKSHKVLTGFNDSPKLTRMMTPKEVKNIGKGNWADVRKSQVTPLGATGIEFHPLYTGGVPGITATSPSHRNIAWHSLGNDQYQAAREERIKSPTLKDNFATNGCMNCSRDQLMMYNALFPGTDRDSAYIVDSRLSIEENKRAFEYNRKIKPLQYRNGGDDINALPAKHPGANAIVESKEVVEFEDGSIGRVPAQGKHIADHDDNQGGTYLAGVQRVLEDTSAKAGRNKSSDKVLLLSPYEVEVLTGFRPKTSVSHAGAFDKASEFYQEKARKVDLINSKYENMSNLNPSQKKALELNNMFLSQTPSRSSLFEILFENQERVKADFGIADGEAKMFRNGGGNNGISKKELGKLRDNMEYHKLTYEINNSPENKKDYERALAIYNKALMPNSTGFHDMMKTLIPKAAQKAGVATPKSVPGSAPTRTSTSANTPSLIQQNQASDPLINSNWGLFNNTALDMGGYQPPYTEATKPDFYDQADAYWNDIYDHTRNQMGMPGFNNVSSQSQHAQYQDFIAKQYGPLVLDAIRSGRMPLTNKHIDLATKLGKQPSELTEQELLDGFVDDGYVMDGQPIDGKKVRGISIVPASGDQALTEIPSTYRAVNFNGKTLYVENKTDNQDPEQPVIYYDLQGNPVSPQSPAATQTQAPQGNTDMSKTNLDNQPQAAGMAKRDFGKNRVPLQWYDTLSPLNALVNASQRYPEMPFTAEVGQVNLEKINPQQALNNIFSQSRTAARDTSNDSVGQAIKAQIFANSNRAIADVIANSENTNTQIKNQEAQYNVQARDKQSLMDATAGQDFHNRVLQSRTRQDENFMEAIDKIGKLYSGNARFNNILNMLDTSNFGYDPETGRIGYSGGNTVLNPNATTPVDPAYNMFAKTQQPQARYQNRSNVGNNAMTAEMMQRLILSQLMMGQGQSNNFLMGL